MQDVVVERSTRESFGHTYAEPLSGLRVSWGSVLAGTVTTLAVSLILWVLALSIVSLAAHPDAASLRGSAIALWVCAMATTLIGAYVGGWFAGYLPGSSRWALGAAHGFLSWAVALILSFAFQFFVVRGVIATAATALAENSVVETQPGGETPGMGNPGMGGNPGMMQGPTHEDVTRAGRAAIDSLVGIGWSWFGTWAVALFLSTAAGAMATARHGERLGTVIREERERHLGPPPPLATPHTTT
jgi:hypothetical protein